MLTLDSCVVELNRQCRLTGKLFTSKGTLMNNFASKRGNTAAFQLNPVAAGCAVFLSILASSAYAQSATAGQAAETPMQTVTVSGIRRGIEDAISITEPSPPLRRCSIAIG